MSKAIEGAAMIGVAVGLSVAFGPEAMAAMPWIHTLMIGMAVGGVSMEAGAIASALTSNRGMGITSRQPAAFRQIIYGEQRIGGTILYQSTTGSHKDQYNFIIVLAGHVCDSIVNLYLDGRQVYWQGSGVGNSWRNGVNFGGNPDGNNHTGPDGVQYNFGGKLYCEARFGDQLPGDVMGSIRANDPNWAASAGGSPWVGGCTYVYLKLEYDTTVFPQLPEIRFTVRGKNDLYDPRTTSRGYSTNWALIVADILTDTQFGLGDTNGVNQDQLIAAANVCDEQVAVAATGGTEARYAASLHYDSSVDPMNAITRLMSAAAGRLSRIGGEWYIWPAYWQGPSFSFDQNALTAAPSWIPYRSLADLCNRVSGTYTAPNHPFNTAGNLYDSNGFYNGQIQNNFPFAFQPASFPMYARDVQHGYAADEYLNEDSGVQGAWDAGVDYGLGDVATYGGVLYRSLYPNNLGFPPAGSPFWTPWQNILPRELTLDTVLSVTQAQRVAKIVLERNRQQGSGTFRMSLAALQMQPCDVMQFTWDFFGWEEKTLEIESVKFWAEQVDQEDGEQAMAVLVEVGVIETDPSVYEWDAATEEQTVYDVPAIPQQQSRIVAPPTNVTLTSSAATAVVGADGVVRPRVMMQWDTPADVLVTGLQIQYRTDPAGGTVGPWIDAGIADVSVNVFFVADVVAGTRYDFRIRSLRSRAGSASVWVELDQYTVSLTLSVETQFALAPGSLIGEAFSDSTAAILPGDGVGSFTAVIGNVRVTVTPGNYPLRGLNQGQSYDVYYVDPVFAGGAVTAIATQNRADYLNKLGYFLIDTVVTPVYSSSSGTGGGGTGGGRYMPTVAGDLGSRGTQNPGAAFDGDVTTAAVVSGSFVVESERGSGTDGQCTWTGWPSVALAYDATLHVSATMAGTPDGAIPMALQVAVGGPTTDLYFDSASAAQADYAMTIPSGTNLSTVTVIANVLGSQSSDSDTTTPMSQLARIYIFEIYIQ